MSCCIHNISHFFLRKKNLVNNMCCSERFFSILFQGHLRTEYSHLVTESEEEKIHMAHAGRKRKNTERQLLPSIFLSSLKIIPTASGASDFLWCLLWTQHHGSHRSVLLNPHTLSSKHRYKADTIIHFLVEKPKCEMKNKRKHPIPGLEP